MLYDEFVKGTGCTENEKNYEVYKNLEAMYMNTDMTKEQIYEYGRKLVDNSKSEKVIEIEKEYTERLRKLKEELKEYKAEIKYNQEMKDFYKQDNDTEMCKHHLRQIKYLKEQIKEVQVEINDCKFILGK
jgi:protein subunit release factor A